MALVHDDQVEEVRGEVAVEAVGISPVGQGLVEPEVDLASGLGLALELPDRALAESGGELAGDRLVDQDVAVSEVEDARLAVTAPGAVPQLPDDLQGDKVLPVPVAIVRRSRLSPDRIACTVRLMATCW